MRADGGSGWVGSHRKGTLQATLSVCSTGPPLGEVVSPGSAKPQPSKHQKMKKIKRLNECRSLSSEWELRSRNREQGAGKSGG